MWKVIQYVLDGRGQGADGRRKATLLPAERVEISSPSESSDDLDLGLVDLPHLTLELPAVDEAELKDAAPPTNRDAYSSYMASLRDLPRLTRDEEHELAVRYLKGHDPEIARQLIEANLKLVVKLAHEYSRAHRNLLDLIQEGNVGLVQAVEKYDPDRGVKLSSYAAWWIRAYMLRFILHDARIVRLGTTATQRKLFFNLRKEKAKLERLGFVASPEAIADAMHVPTGEVIEMQQRLGAPDASLDAPVDREESGRSRLDLIESPAMRPDVATENGEFRERLHEKLVEFGKRLQGRERKLFEERLMSEEPRTLQEIGASFGISRERTRQIEVRLLARLKNYLSAQLGDAVELELGSAAAR
jgi:RNA polymerase sigma-32 factor